MKISERLLLIFNAIITIAFVALIGICLWQTNIFNMIVGVVYSSVIMKIAISGVLAIFVLLSVRAIFCGLAEKKKVATLAATTNEGGIYINIDTISDLALKAVKKVDGVKEVRVRSTMGETGVNIALKLSMVFDAVIPEVSSAVQQSVKSDVESYCGIKVEKITVQVDNSIQAQQ